MNAIKKNKNIDSKEQIINKNQFYYLIFNKKQKNFKFFFIDYFNIQQQYQRRIAYCFHNEQRLYSAVFLEYNVLNVYVISLSFTTRKVVDDIQLIKKIMLLTKTFSKLYNNSK